LGVVAPSANTQKTMCLKEVGLHVQKIVIVLGSTNNVMNAPGGGDMYDQLMSTRIFHFDNE
jgi:hypothetical protein